MCAHFPGRMAGALYMGGGGDRVSFSLKRISSSPPGSLATLRCYGTPVSYAFLCRSTRPLHHVCSTYCFAAPEAEWQSRDADHHHRHQAPLTLRVSGPKMETNTPIVGVFPLKLQVFGRWSGGRDDGGPPTTPPPNVCDFLGWAPGQTLHVSVPNLAAMVHHYQLPQGEAAGRVAGSSFLRSV